MVVADDAAVVFSERLTPSPTAWLLAPGVGLLVFIMFFPVNTWLAVALGAGAGAVGAAWMWSLAAKVELTAATLRVGRAQIEIGALGTVRPCSHAEMTNYMGPGSDARSFVLTRPWVRTGVYVEQIDPRDPTPYWLFSSREPEVFARALTQVRSGR